MAYFLRSWLSAQGRRGFQIFCSRIQFFFCCCLNLKGRMRNGIAFAILGVLFIMVLYSAYNCSSSSSQSVSFNPNSAVDQENNQNQLKQKAVNLNCMDNKNAFSAKRMSDLFQKCAKSDYAQQVDMDLYLDAWEELIRFLNSMGTAFTFVSSDVVDKVGILRDFRKSSAKENYITIQKMIVYEKENNLINYEQAPSKSVKAYGCRTLLRLHRALKFLLILIGKLARNEDNGKVSDMGYNAYHASPMSKYHPWLVRKAVGVAVYMLPDRKTFLKQMCQDMSEDDLANSMQLCSESMDSVYEYTHALYSQYEIIEIP